MKLSSEDIKFILKEAKCLLTEDQESDSIKKAIQLYMNTMGCSKEQADKFVRIDLRQDLPNLRSKKGGKFILGVTRMFLDRQLTTADIIERLNTTIKYIASDAHYNEYDKNLNGLSVGEIVNRFADVVKKDAEKDRDLLSQQQYVENQDYDIVRIDSFDEAQKYSRYTSWCVTHYPNMFNSYTMDGIAQFYFCLKKGFQNVRSEKTEGCPLDEYGLSMIAVCVDGDGRLKTATCRWNHDNGGNDNIMTTKQISEVIGRNFYDVFKPNNRWEEKINQIIQRLKAGDNISDIFDSVRVFDGNHRIVEVSHKYNFLNIDTNELLSKVWFDSYSSKEGRFITVKLNETKSLFNMDDGKLYTYEEAFKYINNFLVEFLKTHDVKELSDAAFLKDAYTYYNKYTEVRFAEKYNLINPEGELVFDTWYSGIDVMKFGNETLFRVNENHEFSLLNSNKEDILGKSYKYISSIVQIHNTLMYEDSNGCNIMSLDYPNIPLCKRYFGDSLRIMKRLEDGGYLFIGKDSSVEGESVYNAEGQRLSPFFDKIITGYSDDIAYVTKDGMCNILFLDDYSIMDTWFDEVWKTFANKYDPLIMVFVNGKKSLVHYALKKLVCGWFDEISDTDGGIRIVENDLKYNFIDENGELCLDKWYHKIESTHTTTFLYVTNDEGKENLIEVDYKNRKQSTIKFKNWYDELVLRKDYSLYVRIGDMEREYGPFEWMYKTEEF